MVISTHLDKTTCVTQKGLQSLESNLDQVVWELATKIYTQSGYKIDFCLVRDEIDTRIQTIKAHLVAEEEERIARKAIEAEEKRAREAAEEEKRIAREEWLYARYVQAWIVETSSLVDGSEIKAWLFRIIQSIAAEQFGVEDSTITLDTNFHQDLNSDSLEVVEFVMAVEEAFDIEIPDEAAEEIHTVQDALDYLWDRVAPEFSRFVNKYASGSQKS